MIISDYYKYIFIANPKTGTTSIQKFLLENDPTARKNILKLNGEYCKVRGHSTANSLKKVMGDKFEEYAKVAFFRDPYSKVVSSYYFYNSCSIYNSLASKKYKWMFSLFRTSQILSAKILPFYFWTLLYPYKSNFEYLCDSDGNLLVDYLGDFQNLKSDFYRIFQNIGLDFSGYELPFINRSNHDEYSLYFRNSFYKGLIDKKINKDFFW
jgi:hypothetical protein